MVKGVRNCKIDIKQRVKKNKESRKINHSIKKKINIKIKL